MESKILSCKLIAIRVFEKGKAKIDIEPEHLYEMCRICNFFHFKDANGNKILYSINNKGEIEKESDYTIKCKINEQYKDLITDYCFKYPNELNIDTLLNVYLNKKYMFPKKNIFEYCPYRELPPQNKHTFNMAYDREYKEEYLKNELLSKFEQWGMMQTIDKVGVYRINCELFYKHIADHKYLIFYFLLNDPKCHRYRFEAYISEYASKSNIGHAPYITEKLITDDFELERDYELIRKYVE